MRFAPALVVSALALQTSAFLVPLEVSQAAEKAKAELASFLSTSANTLNLDCPGCPYFDGGDISPSHSKVNSKIHLEFGVDATGGLTVNGQSIHPKDLATAHPYILTAPQIRQDDGQQTKPLRLDFAFERLPPITADETPGVSIIPLEFTILGLEGVPVKVDTISLQLLQTPEQTTVAKVSRIPFKDTPGATTCNTASRWSVCRLRAILAARLRIMMAAAKARAHGLKGWVKGPGRGCHGGMGRKGGPASMQHGHHRGHHRGHHHAAHRFGRMLHQTLRFFVIPALLGVAGGLLASAIGMLVGQLISFLWIRFHRGGRRGNVHGRVVEVAVDVEEKDALLVHEEDIAPPQYHDLDVEAVSVEDEKK